MIHLPGVLAAAEEVQRFCQAQGWRFCFIGGVAVQRWGEPRLTQDVDLTLLTGFRDEERVIDVLLKVLLPRLALAEAREFGLRHRVMLMRTSKGVDVDIAFGALPFEERTVERASAWSWVDGHEVVTCSAEDLVVHKAFASREMDWSDVERVLIRQNGKLNLDQIRTELKPLLELKGELDALNKLEAKIASVQRRLRGNPC